MLLIPYSLLTFTLIQCSIYRTKPGNMNYIDNACMRKFLAPGKNRPPPSAFRLAENGKKRPIHGKSAQGVTEP